MNFHTYFHALTSKTLCLSLSVMWSEGYKVQKLVLVLIVSACTPWAIKNVVLYFCPYLCQLLTDFQIFFTGTLRSICNNVITIYPITS